MIAHIERTTEQTGWRLSRLGFAASAFCLEILTIVALSVASGTLYHRYAYDGAGMVDIYASLGFLTGLIYTLPYAVRGEYEFHSYLKNGRSLNRITAQWCLTFACLAIIGFFTKTTGTYSRGWVGLFIVTGPLVLIMLSTGIRFGLKRLIDVGRVIPRRILLVGDSYALDSFKDQLVGHDDATRVVASIGLPFRDISEADHEALAELDKNFDEAVQTARSLRLDDVVIFSEWKNHTFADRAVTAFSALPVSIHIGASDLIGRFRNAQVKRFGEVTTVSLAVPPLTLAEAVMKRVFDILVSALALVLLLPVFAVVAAFIKLDSGGPIFFYQKRRGFNLEQFKILKFRTMTTLDDGDVIIQAQKGDNRITRVGHYLRKWNLDELPQLINVLRGDMSLVGPRPHAVAHDTHYERRLLQYPRRLKMRPGITGWAQVHGFRGATHTDEAMQQRLDYDLYYIENWSMSLDIYVLWLTVFSAAAYRNAL